MSKLVVLLMQNEYPFTQNPQYSHQSQNILVRQSLQPSRGNKNTILAKANFAKNLKNKYLVKVDSLFQESENIHVMYEYVETKFSNVVKRASLMLISKVHAQLRQFGTYLSNIGVRILFNMDRIGLTGQDSLKYFMGLDFEWEDDPDQQFLEQFYQKQTEQLLGGYLKQKTIKASIIPESTTGHSFFRNEDQSNKLRKISFSTLPSRYNRFYKIDQKLKEIKSISKGKDIELASKKNMTLQIPTNKNMFEKNIGVNKKFQDRKYSGEVKYEVESKAKLFEKQSDIQSQYWQRKKKATPKQEQSMNSQRESAKTKSRTQQMKEKQYREISSMKKDYLKDFISVLEQDEDNNLILPPNLDHTEVEEIFQKQKSKEMNLKRTDSVLVMHESSTKDLQKLAKSAIEHSLKVMSKFKSMIHDS